MSVNALPEPHTQTYFNFMFADEVAALWWKQHDLETQGSACRLWLTPRVTSVSHLILGTLIYQTGTVMLSLCAAVHPKGSNSVE